MDAGRPGRRGSTTVNWAVAGFLDRSARYRHSFDTERARVEELLLFGFGFTNYARGHASISMSTTRAGGAFAFAPWRKRLSIGAAVYATGLDYDVSALTETETFGNSSSDPEFRYQSTTFESDRVDLSAWGSGLAFSALVEPVRSVALSMRWRREPRFATVRELARRSVLVSGEPGSLLPGTRQDVQFRLPESYAVTGIVSLRRTILVSELARAEYSAVFEPVSGPDRAAVCTKLRSIFCSGWAFTTHRTVDANTWRSGVEQALPLGPTVLRLRAGVAWEQGYTLARASSDPSRTGGSLPAPPVVSAFEPPRQDHTLLSFGAGYQWGVFEVAAGFGRIEHQNRLLMELRVHSR